jgi:hypothetical protein
MTTGTGLVLLGVWLACAATWHSKVVSGSGAIMMTFVAIGLTVFLK